MGPPDPRSRPSRSSCPPGLALLEFLLAASILGVALLGLGGLQVAAARAQGRARDRAVALELAANALERSLAGLRGGGAGFQALDGAPADPLDWACAGGRDGRSDPGAEPFFRIRVTGSPGPDGTRRLRAAVAWPGGSARPLVLERLVAP